MSNLRTFKNVSGQNYYLDGIGKETKFGFVGKRISVGADNIKFSDDDISKSVMLKELIESGKLQEGVTATTNEPLEINSADVLNKIVENESILSFGTVDDKDGSQEKNDNSTHVWWTGPASDAGGYGKMNREILDGLSKKNGLIIQHEPFPIPDIQRSKLKLPESIDKMIGNNVPDDSISVWAIMPPKFIHRKGYKIIYTMLETNGVDKKFLEKCNNADELWVPSKHNIKVFEECGGLKIPIKHMPLGVNTNLYRPMDLTHEQKNKFNIKTKEYVFMSLFGWSLRKGVDVLLRSYLEEFTQKDNVTLMIVSRIWGNASLENIHKIRDDIKNYIKKFVPSGKQAPHIVLVGQTIQEEDLPILYNMSDSFVLPSRGEGYCLPGLEAGACFPANTKIWDGERLINIEEIRTTHRVMNHIGSLDDVLNISERKYSGEMIEIDPLGYFDKIKCTNTHPFFIKSKDGSIKWKMASKITTEDKLLYPIYKPTNEDFIHRGLKIDEDLAYVLGWYCAEGSIQSNNHTTLTFHAKEIKYAKEICEIIDKKFGNCSRIATFENKNHIRVYVSSSKFARLCHDLIDRGSYFKKVSTKIKNSKQAIRESFIKGYFLGDAHLGQKNIDVVSASKDLLLGLRDILLSLGIISSLFFRKSTKKASHYCLYVGAKSKRHLLKICSIDFVKPKGNGGKAHLSIESHNDQEYLCYGIKYIKNYYVENLPVYNLSIKNEESYIVEQFAVHNCKLPVIMTRCTGQLDYLTDENSYLIDIEGFDADSQEVKEIARQRISSYYENQPFAVLGETAVSQLKAKMRFVFENRDEANKKAQLLYNDIRDNFTWQHLVDRIHERLKEI